MLLQTIQEPSLVLTVIPFVIMILLAVFVGIPAMKLLKNFIKALTDWLNRH